MKEKNGKTRSSESSCVSLDYCNYVTTNNKLVKIMKYVAIARKLEKIVKIAATMSTSDYKKELTANVCKNSWTNLRVQLRKLLRLIASDESYRTLCQIDFVLVP